MKPIIIGITKDGKVDMSLDEFRKHMDEAYWQGHRDNTYTQTLTGTSKWWLDQMYCNICGDTDGTTTATDSALFNDAKQENTVK